MLYHIFIPYYIGMNYVLWVRAEFPVFYIVHRFCIYITSTSIQYICVKDISILYALIDFQNRQAFCFAFLPACVYISHCIVCFVPRLDVMCISYNILCMRFGRELCAGIILRIE